MVKLWHVFGYIDDRTHLKFISKVIASEDKEGAVNILMQTYKASSFQIISINEIELESGMMFDIH